MTGLAEFAGCLIGCQRQHIVTFVQFCIIIVGTSPQHHAAKKNCQYMIIIFFHNSINLIINNQDFVSSNYWHPFLFVELGTIVYP